MERGKQMYQFPQGIYTDIRIEHTITTFINYKNEELKQNKTRNLQGAMIRVYNGKRWFYSSVSDLHKIQQEINSLANMAKENTLSIDDSLCKRFEKNTGIYLQYKENCVADIPNSEKIELMEGYLPILKEYPDIQMTNVLYKDCYIEKEFYSSEGANICFDYQCASCRFFYTLSYNGYPYNGMYSVYKNTFSDLYHQEAGLKSEIERDIEFARTAESVKPGNYICILSPEVTGVFAHESFGHKSEADLTLGDEALKREWKIGNRVGASILNIIDDGSIFGSGYVSFDDEGTKSKKSYLIKNGILTGRLHTASTAEILNEEITGNARAVSFEFEPIVRMTTTYIDKGSQTKEELFQGVEDGLYIETLSHGSGMSTFTIAPIRAYRIINGKISDPVKISVISGNVMKTLNEIDGISDKVEIKSNAFNGCGKLEQYPLSVAFGGPYIRVKGMQVQ